MDLISRKSVAKKMLYRRDYVGRPSDPDCIIADEPSAPAVPLDKLCEWLNVHCGRPNDCKDRLCGKCQLDGEGFEYETCWKTMLKEWMEELEDGKADKR